MSDTKKVREAMDRLKQWLASSSKGNVENPYHERSDRSFANDVALVIPGFDACPHCGKSTKPQTYGERVAEKMVVLHNSGIISFFMDGIAQVHLKSIGTLGNKKELELTRECVAAALDAAVAYGRSTP